MPLRTIRSSSRATSGCTDVYNEMRLQNTPLSEPGIVGYHAKAKALYDSLRQRQKDYPQRLANGETLEALTEETWQLLCDNA